MTDQPSRLAPVSEAPVARQQLEAALFEIKRVIVGQEAMLERVLVALLSGGHLLIEGVPGLAKTRTIA
ncbi:MAG TPA: ATPase, partial [Actinomycetota bacterium]|nr:ATPase [Actinomycetota bacterium]